MPTEIRRLIFTPDELAGALSDFISSNRSNLEPGKVLSIEIRGTAPLSIRAHVQFQSGRQSKEVFEEALICAALISWCMNNKVPLPRRATKAVHQTRDNCVALDAKLTL